MEGKSVRPPLFPCALRPLWLILLYQSCLSRFRHPTLPRNSYLFFSGGISLRLRLPAHGRITKMQLIFSPYEQKLNELLTIRQGTYCAPPRQVVAPIIYAHDLAKFSGDAT